MGLFDAIGDACSAVADVVSDVADVVVDSAEVMVDVATMDFEGVFEGVGDLVGGVGEVFGSVTKALGPIGDVLNEAVGIIASGGGLGGMLNAGLDALGLPDWIGDVAGGVLDFCTGNYVGAVANGLDALEDVAKSCGGDEIAGFLKAGSQVTGMFSGPVGGSAGKIGELIGGASDTLSTVENAMNGVESLMNGDIVGAGTALIDGLGGDVAGLDSLVGPLSADGKKVLDAVLPHANTLLKAAGAVLEDGKIDFNDLARLPYGDMAKMMGIDSDKLLDSLNQGLGGGVEHMQLEDLLSSMRGPVFDFMSMAQTAAKMLQQGQSLAETPLAETLLGGITDSMADSISGPLRLSPEDLGRIAEQVKNVADLFNMGAADPTALGILKDLFAQAPALQNTLETILQQSSTLRA